MNKIIGKTLSVAALALCAAQANAVAVTWNITGTLSDFDTGVITGSGSGDWNDGTGTLTITGYNVLSVSGFSNFDVVSGAGSYDEGSNTGSAVTVSCTDNGGFIDPCTLGAGINPGDIGPITFTVFDLDAAGNGGARVSVAQDIGIGTIQIDQAWEFNDGPVPPAPVPLPAAAWLFGSALLGLAGVSRKRKA